MTGTTGILDDEPCNRRFLMLDTPANRAAAAARLMAETIDRQVSRTFGVPEDMLGDPLAGPYTCNLSPDDPRHPDNIMPTFPDTRQVRRQKARMKAKGRRHEQG